MILNCKGKPCPRPVVLSIQALKSLPKGEDLEVIVDNQAAVENVMRLGLSKGCLVTTADNGDSTWTVTLTQMKEPERPSTKKAGQISSGPEAVSGSSPAEGSGSSSPEADADELSAEEEAAAFCTVPAAPAAAPRVIAIGTNEMGQGDSRLGYNLMKAFLYAVSQQEQLPDTILFFNGGAKLTVEGSESLQDLKYMESEGVEILTCGTCLDFLGFTERLRVGSITNMYTIVEKMNSAGHLIRM